MFAKALLSKCRCITMNSKALLLLSASALALPLAACSNDPVAEARFSGTTPGSSSASAKTIMETIGRLPSGVGEDHLLIRIDDKGRSANISYGDLGVNLRISPQGVRCAPASHKICQDITRQSALK